MSLAHFYCFVIDLDTVEVVSKHYQAKLPVDAHFNALAAPWNGGYTV